MKNIKWEAVLVQRDGYLAAVEHAAHLAPTGLMQVVFLADQVELALAWQRAGGSSQGLELLLSTPHRGSPAVSNTTAPTG